ncbi:DUF4238 domain-containing protein [Lentzea chajnantorensis]
MRPWTSRREAFSHEYEAHLLRLQPEAENLIKKQHIVSQVLLRQFAGQDKNGGASLVPFDVKNGRELNQTGPAGCAWIPHFVPYASKSVEELWQTVEDKIGAAIDKIEQGRLDLNTARIIKDAIALHLVRSTHYMKIHHDSAKRVPNRILDKALREQYRALRCEYLKRHGHEPSPADLIRFTEKLITEQAEERFDGSHTRVMIEHTFNSAKRLLSNHAVQIWRTPPNTELLISDSPAFTMQYSADRRITRTKVAIGDAHTVVMPLSRTTLACTGLKKKRSVLTTEQVDFFNATLIRDADRFVYYHPDSGLRAFVSLTQATLRTTH